MSVTYKCVILIILAETFHAKTRVYYAKSEIEDMGQCSSMTSERVHDQFYEITSRTTIKLTEKRITAFSRAKSRSEISQNETRAETPSERRRCGCCSHDDCSGLVFVADPTGGVWIDKSLERQR